MENNIKYIIGLVEAKAFVDTVVELCYDEKGDYLPFLKDFAIHYAILKYYVGYPVEDYSIDELYINVFGGLFEQIKDVFDKSKQLTGLLNGVDEEFRIRTGKKIHQTKLSEVIDKLIEIFSEELKNPEVVQMINEIVEEIKGDSNGEE